MYRYLSTLVVVFALVACSEGPVRPSMDSDSTNPTLSASTSSSSSSTSSTTSSSSNSEVVWVDARLVGNPAGPKLSTTVLEAGVDYRITVEGNWSAWLPSWWTCTSPSPTVHMSPSVPDGIYAGMDAEWRYADAGNCNRTLSQYAGIMFSLDAGTTAFNPTPVDGTYNTDHTYEYIVTGTGNRIGFHLPDTNEDNHGVMKVTIEEIVPPTVNVFTSDPATVQAWGPILELPINSSWVSQFCTVNPKFGLDDPRWGSPHAAYEVGPASFESWTSWSGFDAPWINAWNNLQASAAPGAQNGTNTQSWSKFASTVSGNGTFVVQFLADNCSWIYLDGNLVGVQAIDWNTNPAANGRYSLTLSGTHTLSFIVFDGGGQAGGKFRLETLSSFVGGGGDPGDVNPPLPSDNTAPVITPNVTGTLNGDWYTSDVNISWTVTDDESDVTNTTGCETVTVSEDTTGVTFTCEATSDGGTASESVTVKRDATPPVVTASVSGTMGNNGWYTSNVAVSFNVSEPTSPLSTTGCDAVTVSTDTNGATYTCEASSAGGTASKSVTVKRDATKPMINFAGNAGTYTVAQSVNIGCSATDSMSGIASSDCPGASGDAYTFGVGTTTLNASALDKAGNSNSATTSFNVTVTSGSVCELVKRWVSQRGVANSLCQQLNNGAYSAFIKHARAQSGKHVPADKAAILIALVEQL